EAGQTVPFGPIGVGRAGLTCKDRSIAWQEIDRLAIDVVGPTPTGGLAGIGLHLLVGAQGGLWAAEPFLPIPNRALLANLLEQLRPSNVPLTVTGVVEFFQPDEK